MEMEIEYLLLRLQSSFSGRFTTHECFVQGRRYGCNSLIRQNAYVEDRVMFTHHVK